MYDNAFFKNGATIIDIGISSVDGKTYGDIDTNGIGEVVSARAPFPGGVGPITVSALFFNLSRLIQTN
jgi:methylenetetrahydrofolate dehydrogenase (NADP+)/methenyltetrahydrofolate cyclohydrolase